MSVKTGISWTDSTWNPIRGCSRVSAGCMHCYAESVANRYSGPGLPYEGLTTSGKWNGKIAVIEKHMLDPIRWQKGRKIFVNSMSDLFHENVTDETIDRVHDIMETGNRTGTPDRHVFQILTKRPERMQQYVERRRAKDREYAVQFDSCPTEAMRNSPAAKIARRIADVGYPHIWYGVSVEDQPTLDARLPPLLRTRASVRWISYEPALAAVDFTHAVNHGECAKNACAKGKIDWLVVGGESGPGHRPMGETIVAETVAQCRAAGVAVWVKQDSGPKSGLQGRIPDELFIHEFPVPA